MGPEERGAPTTEGVGGSGEAGEPDVLRLGAFTCFQPNKAGLGATSGPQGQPVCNPHAGQFPSSTVE